MVRSVLVGLRQHLLYAYMGFKVIWHQVLISLISIKINLSVRTTHNISREQQWYIKFKFNIFCYMTPRVLGIFNHLLVKWNIKAQ